MQSLLIRDAYVVVDGEAVFASVLVVNGKIAALAKDPSKFRDVDEVVDGSGLLALPGSIDIHAHIYDPDYSHHEDFRSGTIAAIYGGITTVFDMPLRTYVDNVDALKIKISEGLRNSFANFGILAGMMNEDNVRSIRALRKEGVRGFKLFTCKPFRPKSESAIAEVISEVSRSKALTIVHAEDDILIDYLVNYFKREGRNEPIDHHLSRPPEAEASAITRVIEVAKYLNAKVHIAHVSSALGAKVIKEAKAGGIRVTAETCPQYLYFTRDDVVRWGNYLKITPSLKSKSDVNYLWQSLADGTIDAVASDHAPSPRDEKELDVWSAWGGIPVIEVMLPFVFTYGVKKLGILTIERFIEVVSENPARIIGLYPVKGSITLGSDADIIVIDPNKYVKVTADSLHHKVDWTPFEGMLLTGWPKYVVVNGRLLLSDGELIGENRLVRYI
ncbi:MAG: dihydroorotase family protein [Desulfurococcales archaeon]|nr:dihydroorotase family protein [Desulfurococcales archaeon]